MIQRPLVWFAAIWLVGGVSASMLEVPAVEGWLLAAAAAGLLAICWLKLPGSQAAAAVLTLLAGFAHYEWYDGRNVPAVALEAETAIVEAEGVILSTVEVDGDRAAFTFCTDQARLDGEDAAGNAGGRDKLRVTVRLETLEEQTAARGWGRGDRIRLAGTLERPQPARNFGGFDYREYLRLQHVHYIVTVKGAANLSRLAPPEWGLLRALRWNDGLRDQLGERLDLLYGPEQGGFMKGLIVGQRDDLDPERFQQFSSLGLTHILAISGLHVAVYLAGIAALLRLFGCTKETVLTVSFWVLPGYVLLTGASPSVVRAGLMAMIALYAARKAVLKDGLHILCAALWIMLLWKPYYLHDVSFQLSFLVTAGLIVGVTRVTRLLPLRNKWIAGSLSVGLTAQAVSFPLSIHYFNQYSLLSLPANLVLVPVLSLITLPLGSVALLVGLAYVPAGRAIAYVTELINSAVFRIVEAGAALGGFQSIWPELSLGAILLYYALLAAVYAGLRLATDGGRRLPAAAAAVLLGLFLWHVYDPDRWNRDGAVHVIDVGQGDAILVRTPSDKHMLIDGGGTLRFTKPGEEWRQRSDPFEVGADVLVPLLKKRGVHRIDTLVLTHLDHDHIGGLQAVLEQIPVGRILYNGTWKAGEDPELLFRTALQRRIPVYAVAAGMVVELDAHTQFDILHPLQQREDRAVWGEEEQNEVSVAGVLDLYGTRILLTGDIGSEQEAAILQALRQRMPPATAEAEAVGDEAEQAKAAAEEIWKIDVLKVGHHGSKNSTSAEWLEFWSPTFAVVSAGFRNVYGHPHPDVVRRLEDAGAQVRRTDRAGEVIYRIDGQGQDVEVATKLVN